MDGNPSSLVDGAPGSEQSFGASMRCGCRVGFIRGLVSLHCPGVEESGQAGTGVHAELAVDVAEADFDGFWAEEEPGGYFLVGKALGDLQGDAQFLRGEACMDWRAAGRGG